jgi:hypothetical protein
VNTRGYSHTPTADNQKLMADEGGISMLITLMRSKNEQIQRQACKALANLGVNGEALFCVVIWVVRCRPLTNTATGLAAANKERIAKEGGIEPLIELASSKNLSVCIEAVAALANLAVNGELMSGRHTSRPSV